MIVRILAVLVVIAGAVVAVFVWHHPPMRLMPAPLLFHDDGSALASVAGALATDSRIGSPPGYRGSRAGRPDLRELSTEATEALLAAAAENEIEILRVEPANMPDLPASSHPSGTTIRG